MPTAPVGFQTTYWPNLKPWTCPFFLSYVFLQCSNYLRAPCNQSAISTYHLNGLIGFGWNILWLHHSEPALFSFLLNYMAISFRKSLMFTLLSDDLNGNSTKQYVLSWNHEFLCISSDKKCKQKILSEH